MEVIAARTAGFCFGVKRAVCQVYDCISREQGGSENLPICTYGPIIHNETVVEDLKSRGVRVIHGASELAQCHGGTIIIRSHGVSEEEENQIQATGAKVYDMTCPFVKKIQRIARQAGEEGKRFIIAGNPVHPEVTGILGWCRGEAQVIQSPEDLDRVMADGKPSVLAAQTTFNKNKFDEIVDSGLGKGYNLVIARSVCSATVQRQEEAARIASKVDGMLVVGSPESSNTRKLYEICKSKCFNTHYIQTADDLNQQWFLTADRVGVTAGASTPQNIIEEVLRYVRGI